MLQAENKIPKMVINRVFFCISILIPYVAISYSYFRTYGIDIFEHVNLVFFIPD